MCRAPLTTFVHSATLACPARAAGRLWSWVKHLQKLRPPVQPSAPRSGSSFVSGHSGRPIPQTTWAILLGLLTKTRLNYLFAKGCRQASARGHQHTDEDPDGTQFRVVFPFGDRRRTSYIPPHPVGAAESTDQPDCNSSRRHCNLRSVFLRIHAQFQRDRQGIWHTVVRIL